LMLDEGAIDALVQRGKSLLPSGIIQVSGTFDPGDAVLCTDCHGKEVAKGLINFSSILLEKMKGLKTTDIKKTVGDQEYEEAIHRDNLVIL
jgi:glutamate 5-kinase